MAFQTKIRLSDDKVIQIGGVSLTLSGDTKIDNNGTIEYVSNRHGDYVNRSLVDKEYVDLEIDALTGITNNALTGATNGLNTDTDPRIVELGGELTQDVVFSGGTLNYADDYSASFSANTLISRNYVDSSFVTLSTTQTITGLKTIDNNLLMNNAEEDITTLVGVHPAPNFYWMWNDWILYTMVDTSGKKDEWEVLFDTQNQDLWDRYKYGSTIEGYFEGTISIDNPDAFKWKIVVDGVVYIFVVGNYYFTVSTTEADSFISGLLYTEDGVEITEDIFDLFTPTVFDEIIAYTIHNTVKEIPFPINGGDAISKEYLRTHPAIPYITESGGGDPLWKGDVWPGTENIDEITGITSIAITGATNGLTKSGRNAVLGGVLTGNTTICGGGIRSLCLGSSVSKLTDFFVEATGGAYIDPAYEVYLRAQTSCFIIGGDLGLMAKSGTNDGIKYDTNYGAGFSARSLPDVHFVTGITSTIEEITDLALTGATNGLSVSGRNAVLGGNLTGNTQISGASNNLSIIDIGTFTLYGFGAGRNITLETDGGQLLLDATNASLRNCLSGSFVITTANGAIYTDSGSPTANGGIKYNADYQSTYTLRSLPDVNYVTGLTSGITEDIEEISGVTSVALTGASNGLNTDANARVVELGGALTKPTTLSGSEIFGINVNQINLTGSTTSCGINLGGTVSLKTDPAGTGGLLCRDATTGEIQQTSLAAFGGITGATNGLSDCGSQEIGLGGTLCATTSILGAEFALDLGTAGSKLSTLSVNTSGAVGITSGDLSINSSGATFTDLSAVKEGIKYNADYSTTYVDRSLVDKGYVDAVATGLQPHEAVLAATTGQTTLSGEQTVDGIALVTGDRVLVKNQSTASQNGIYVVAAGAWTRADDFNNDPLTIEVKSGDLVPVLSGDTQAATIWILTTPDPITIDTTPLTFTLFSRSLSYIGGDGISITQGTGLNQTIAVDLATNSGLCFNSAQLSVAPSIAGTGLSWLDGVINANAIADGVAGISVRVDGSDNLVVNAADINTALGGAITAATNGLTANAGTVCLGGALTTGTTICGTDTNSFTYQDNAVTNKRGILYADDYSATYIARSLVDAGYVTGLTDTITTNFNTFTGETRPIIDVSITGVTNGLTKIGSHDAVLGGTLTGDTIFTGTGSNYHLQYAADYSTAFTARSIPDAAWVTGQTTTAGLQDAENGLTKTGTTVVLGGTLTGDTYIDGNGTVGILTINDINSITISTIGAVNDTGGYVNINTTGVVIEGNDNVTTGARLNINTDNSLIISTYNAGTFSGATYGGDYESNFVARTLVTAQYVTGITSGIIEDVEEISGVTSVALTGATNGLTKSGRNATLGGALTGNTVISGASTYSLGLGASGSLLTALNVHATSSNFNSTLSVSGATVLGSTLNVSGNTIIDGTVTLNNVTTGTASDNVLLIDSSNVVKQISASEFGNITGATNGTCVDGRNVVLGGTLTGNTEISGATHNLTISNLSQLCLSSSNVGSYVLTTSGGANITSGNNESISLSSANEINATADSNINLTAGDNSNIILDATAGTTGNINVLADTQVNITVPTTNINSTNFNVTGTTTLNTVASGDSTQDSVLVRTSAGEVRQVPATNLGEDNNNYDILVISSNTTLDETNYTVLVNSSGSSITVTLPANPIDGQAYKIKDYAGDALTNNIIINGNGKPIDGGGATINTDYGALEIVFSTDTISGGGWYVMSFVN